MLFREAAGIAQGQGGERGTEGGGEGEGELGEK